MNSNSFNRRRFLGASAAVAVAPYIRTSHAAGSLAVGFWDHWVPGANDALAKLCNEWAAREKVDLKIDFITSQGNKLLLPSGVYGVSRRTKRLPRVCLRTSLNGVQSNDLSRQVAAMTYRRSRA